MESLAPSLLAPSPDSGDEIMATNWCDIDTTFPRGLTNPLALGLRLPVAVIRSVRHGDTGADLMARYRPTVFQVIPSGQPLLGMVTLYQGTWDNHIITNHPELIGKERLVEQVVQNPTLIHEGTVPGSTDYLFFNATVTNSSGQLLRVVVRAGGLVVTAYFTSSTGGGKQLWP